MEKRFVNIDLPYDCEETKRRCNLFKKFLKDNDIYFETSGVNHGSLFCLHFEILCTPEQDFIIDDALDRLVFYDEIGAV